MSSMIPMPQARTYMHGFYPAYTREEDVPMAMRGELGWPVFGDGYTSEDIIFGRKKDRLTLANVPNLMGLLAEKTKGQVGPIQWEQMTDMQRGWEILRRNDALPLIGVDRRAFYEYDKLMPGLGPGNIPGSVAKEILKESNLERNRSKWLEFWRGIVNNSHGSRGMGWLFGCEVPVVAKGDVEMARAVYDAVSWKRNVEEDLEYDEDLPQNFERASLIKLLLRQLLSEADYAKVLSMGSRQGVPSPSDATSFAVEVVSGMYYWEDINRIPDRDLRAWLLSVLSDVKFWRELGRLKPNQVETMFVGREDWDNHVDPYFPRELMGDKEFWVHVLSGVGMTYRSKYMIDTFVSRSVKKDPSVWIRIYSELASRIESKDLEQTMLAIVDILKNPEYAELEDPEDAKLHSKHDLTAQPIDIQNLMPFVMFLWDYHGDYNLLVTVPNQSLRGLFMRFWEMPEFWKEMLDIYPFCITSILEDKNHPLKESIPLALERDEDFWEEVKKFTLP